MKNILTVILSIMALITVSIVQAETKPDTPSFAWANGFIYSANYSTNYQPADGPRNTLYVFDGLKGQRPVAEAGPGDPNYQDGRWQVVILEFTAAGKAAFDINNDGYSEFEITSWDMAQHYMITHGYLKVAGRGSIFDAALIRPAGLEPPDTK